MEETIIRLGRIDTTAMSFIMTNTMKPMSPDP